MTNKVKSIFVTLRPRNGIINSDVTMFMKKIKNVNYMGSYVVLEKNGCERHLHAVVWYANPIAMRDQRRSLERMFRSMWTSRDDSIWTVACRQKQCYNDSVYESYLLGQIGTDGSPKGDDCEVVMNDVPPKNRRMECYSDPVQKQVDGDAKYQKLVRMFWSWKDEKLRLFKKISDSAEAEFQSILWGLIAEGIDVEKPNFVSFRQVEQFLIEMIYMKKKLYVPSDRKKIKIMNFHLFNYLTNGVYFHVSSGKELDNMVLFPCIEYPAHLGLAGQEPQPTGDVLGSSTI